jgi:hypothetical protein
MASMLLHDHASGGCCGGGGGAGQRAGQGGCCKGEASASGNGSAGAKSGGCCGGRSAMSAQMAEDLTRPMGWEEMATLPPLHLVMRSRKGVENLDRRVFELTEQQIDQAYLPEAGVGRWPVRVLIGHLADAEIAAVHRMRRIVGEQNPMVSLWDEDAFIDAGLYHNAPKDYATDEEVDRSRVMHALGGYMAVMHTLRQWSGQWLLTLDDAQWNRAMMHPQRGSVTLRQYVAINTWHVEHHAAFLAKKLDKVLGPAREEAPVGGGCCGGR